MAAVARAPRLRDAHAVRARLAARGVESFIRGEPLLDSFEIQAGDVGEVTLYVKESEAAQARAILSEPRAALAAGQCCPRCQSPEVELRRPSWFMFLGYALTWHFAAAWRSLRARWTCYDCDHAWDAPQGFEVSRSRRGFEVTPADVGTRPKGP
jgi:hypothetical protein